MNSEPTLEQMQADIFDQLMACLKNNKPVPCWLLPRKGVENEPPEQAAFREFVEEHWNSRFIK